MELKFQVHTKIQKPVNEVFDAFYDPKKLSQFFTTGGSTGPLDEGSTVMWSWHDYPESFPVEVVKMVPNSTIALEWATTSGGYSTRTEITFEELGPEETLVRISESGWKSDEQGLKDSYGNCFGWTEVLCCAKAWLEYGINLRKGAHEGMYDDVARESASA